MIALRLAALMVAASLAACGPPAPRAPHTFDIVIDQLAFGPAPADLHVGDTVRWVNKDLFQHSATARAGGFDLDLPAGATGSTVLKQGGTIPYICRYHPGMKGQLSVTP